MLPNKEEYLKVNAKYDAKGLEIILNEQSYKIEYPTKIWRSLNADIKQLIVDHIAFMATNYLPLVLSKRGVEYNTRSPLFESFVFKSTVYDLPSSAALDKVPVVDYIKKYYNLDFNFAEGESRVWSKKYRPRKKAIISFTSGKESLLTAAVCRELGIEPILINVIEPSNIYEEKHRRKLLRKLAKEFDFECYMLKHEPGIFHDGHSMGYKPSSLGWGSQLLYYLFLYLPFLLYHRASYIFFGNENSCDKETMNHEGFRTNYCYDQSSQWTQQMNNILRTLTQGSASVGSLVGPLNEIAVTKVLHDHYPELAKYQMSCFCEDPPAEDHRWCCTCSKCARTYAFIRGLGKDPKRVGFWKDMFTEEHKELYSAFGGDDTFGFDSSGLGRDEQELALYLAAQREPDNKFLEKYVKVSRYNGIGGEGGARNEKFRREYEFYLSPQPYRAIPDELKDKVYELYRRLLNY